MPQLIVKQHDPDIFTIDNVLTAEECKNLIERAESIGFEPASVRTSDGPKRITNIRNNERVVINDEQLAAQLYARISGVLTNLDGCKHSGVDSQLRFYRYVPGQKFNRHKDGSVTNANGETSKLSYLIYLNTPDGGETVFREYKTVNGEREKWTLNVKPVAGNALLFRHHRWHEGTPVNTGEKYVIRTDVFFGQ